MPDKRSCHWIGAGIGIAIVTAVGWFIVNNSSTVNVVGVLQHLGWPFSNVYLCSAAGAALGIVGEVARAHLERRHTRQLAELAESLGFRHFAEVSAQDLSEWQALPVFQKWSGARDRMSGKVSGLPVEMVDYTYVVRGDEGNSTYEQTVVLLVADDKDLPAFDLQPRTLGVRFLNLVGVEGIRFSSQGVSAVDAEVIERFSKNYHLSTEGLEAEAIKPANSESAASADQEAALRRLFSLEMLNLFADHPGWYVQGVGRRLALWRPGKIVAPANRPGLLEEALTIRAALVKSAQRSPTSVSLFAGARTSPEMVNARIHGATIGAIGGFVTGSILGTWIFFNFPDPGVLGFALVFFGGSLGGLFLGMFLGSRAFAGPLERALRRRQERLLPEHNDRPYAQPVTSTASVAESTDGLTIALPPPGLVRGCDWFTFIWAIFWNVFLVILTPLFLMAAFQGQMKWEGGAEPVHPSFMALFLTPFWLIGLVALLIIVYRGRRSALITMSPNRLIIEEFTLFGTRRHEWPRDKLTGVSLTGAKLFRPELVVQSLALPEVHLFGYRHGAELAWIAKVLKEKISVAQPKPHSGTPGLTLRVLSVVPAPDERRDASVGDVEGGRHDG
jgi:hypothetical protein